MTDYRPGLDALVRSVLTPEDVQRTDEIIDLATQHPAGVRRVRAQLRCNQLRWDFRTCDWSEWIEARSDEIEARARNTIAGHLYIEHRSLGKDRIRTLVNAIATTVSDFGS